MRTSRASLGGAATRGKGKMDFVGLGGVEDFETWAHGRTGGADKDSE